MSSDHNKQSPSPAPSPTPVVQQPQKLPSPVRNPLISRRAFIVGALGASVLLAAGSFATSGGFLGPTIPPVESENGIIQHTITDWVTLDNNYKAAVSAALPGQALDPLDLAHNGANSFASFFYWPYPSSASPYYKDIVIRLPDKNPDGSGLSLTPQSDILTISNGARFAAFNTTCVHLRCLVNPGYTSEYRLLCPCHGSQYRLVDGVPAAGPAFDLGLKPLPQVKLTLDSTGTKLVAVPFGKNPDGSPILLNGDPGIGRT